ncbi:MAG: ABC transporter ATP-binding protein [Lactobacillales bacterium]|jgi:ABC-2 type transport system ATP-binding protein|nr:ABC transporter ATP-binding protein [Lactobacillales bacterium]
MLKVQNLSKKYKKNDFYSLKDVSFEIDKGEIVGLIGKNGAGKTTLLKMLAKSYIPSEGTVFYNDTDLYSEDNLLEPFGLMIETVFYPHLTVVENLDFYLSIHKKTEYRKNIQPILELVELWAHRDKKPTGFSFGMKQRLSLAISLVAEPEFMILDEPFIGLDPDGVFQLLSILKQWATQRQTSIIISSHQLNELEEICDRFLFIEAGKLKDEFDSEGQEITVIVLKKPLPKGDVLKDKFPELLAISEDGLILEIDSTSSSINQLLAELTTTCEIKNIHTKETKLNQYFSGGIKQ